MPTCEQKRKVALFGFLTGSLGALIFVGLVAVFGFNLEFFNTESVVDVLVRPDPSETPRTVLAIHVFYTLPFIVGAALAYAFVDIFVLPTQIIWRYVLMTCTNALLMTILLTVIAMLYLLIFVETPEEQLVGVRVWILALQVYNLFVAMLILGVSWAGWSANTLPIWLSTVGAVGSLISLVTLILSTNRELPAEIVFIGVNLNASIMMIVALYLWFSCTSAPEST